jgi:hypothetical protein
MYPPISYRTVTSPEPIHRILYITDMISIPAVLPDRIAVNKKPDFVAIHPQTCRFYTA